MSERSPRTLEVGFAPWMIAGVRTQWDNMLPHVMARPGLRAHVVEITPYKEGGTLERLPLVPPTVKGNVRSMAASVGLFRQERLDAVWTQEVRSILPYLATKARWQRTPVVFTTDSTSLLEASFGEGHYAKAPAGTLRAKVRDSLDALCMHATILNPWSEWCAKSLRDDYPTPPERIHVIPPGIDLARWPLREKPRGATGPLRALFVGGDFRRKGGELLLSAFRGALRGSWELHLVTRDDVPASEGVFVYRNLKPNDFRFRELYARADVFVLPTFADCFSLASLEAMATGLPVITTRVGGIPEIVDHERSGFLVAPGDEEAVARALRELAGSPELRARMGEAGRRIVEARFDAARTTARLLDLIESLARGARSIQAQVARTRRRCLWPRRGAADCSPTDRAAPLRHGVSDPPSRLLAMTKAARAARVEHVCTGCGFRTSRWVGRCPGCGEWASIVEECAAASVADAVGIDRVPAESGERLHTGIGELDRVLGGGLVPGAVVLLAGEPGIGKSTLLLAALDRLARAAPDRAVLYVSGEESLAQIRMRGERLSALSQGLLLRSDASVTDALAAADRLRPLVLAVDSVQTLYVAGSESAAGSVTQVREVAARLLEWAKRTGTPALLVGHVTKEGGIAGPRVLEHLVDAVLSFEGDRSHAYRILRACKNRFGSTNEIGVFEMKGKGLEEVQNPSALFLAERPRGSSGSAVAAVMNGTRPLLVEVQALVADTAGGGSARRTAIGVDSARVALLTAVLERKQGIVLSDQDIYVNVVGGATLDEPAADLAVAAALVSSFRDVPLDPRTVILGEVGLAGEVRGVTQVDQRLAEAAQLGFARCILPESNARRVTDAPLELCGVGTVGAAVEALLI